MLATARQGDKIARPNLRFRLSHSEGALAFEHINRLFVGAMIMARKGGGSRLDFENARAETLHPGSRGERFAPITELALGSFSPGDLVLIHYICGSHFRPPSIIINVDITICILIQRSE